MARLAEPGQTKGSYFINMRRSASGNLEEFWILDFGLKTGGMGDRAKNMRGPATADSTALWFALTLGRYLFGCEG
jgi:hypothetical protein